MHIVSHIAGEQLNMGQFETMSLGPHPQIGPFYEEICPDGWQAQNSYLKSSNVSD